MRRTCSFARRSTRIVTIDTIFVAVVLAPHMLAPTVIVRQRLLRIAYFATVGMTQLLSEFYRTRRAILHTPSASNALVFVHVRNVCATRHIWRIEQLAGTQRIAYIKIAVAYGKDFTFTVDIGNLVYKSVVFGTFQNIHCLFVGYVNTFARFAAIVRHIPYADTPQIAIVGTALVKQLSSVTTTAHACADMPFVTFEPVTDMFDVHRLIFHFDGFFHGYDMHAYACSSRRHHCGDVFQRQKGHALEKHGKLRMTVHKPFVHVCVLCRAGDKQRNPILAIFLIELRTGDRTFLGVLVAVVVFQHTEFAEFLQQSVEFLQRTFVVDIAHFAHFRIRIVFAHFHFEHEVECGFRLLLT